jgi:DNA replication protein DnaC
LNGPYGVGKTHLAVAAVVERENRGDDVFFATVADLLDHLRATFAPDSPITHEDLLDRIRTADVLVLDDMGAERNTPFAEDKLFQIINYRYEEQSPTIITTSQSIEDIAIARPRIASRLQDRQVVTEWPIEAPDYRLGGARR